MGPTYRLSREEQRLLNGAAEGALKRLLAPLSASGLSLRVKEGGYVFPGDGALLVFKMRDLLPLTLHALRSPEHRPAKDQLMDRRLWHDMRMPPTAADIRSGAWHHVDPRKVPPALELVSDHGVYLMSNGIPVQPSRVRDECESVFALGYDPYQDEHWQKWSTRILGGQKVSKKIPLDWVRRAYLRKEHELRIKVARNSLKLDL